MSDARDESRNERDKALGKTVKPTCRSRLYRSMVNKALGKTVKPTCRSRLYRSMVDKALGKTVKPTCRSRLYLAESFEDMDLCKEILQGIKAHAFGNPTPLQQRVIVPLTKGYDVVIQTCPGTGKKTAAAIAVLQSIDPDLQACQALILSPSGRVAKQMQKIITDMGDNMKFQCHLCITGNSLKNDVRELKDGVHVVAGNLERVYDLINRRALRTHKIKMFVIENAGEMLSGIFRDEICDIIKALKSNVQLLLLSSLMESNVLFASENILHYPAFSVNNNIIQVLRNEEHFYISVSREHSKAEILCRLCGKMNFKQCIIFCQTKQKIDWIKEYLRGREFVVSTFHHGLCDNKRDMVMREFCSGSTDILITNDIVMCSNVQEISLIINYDFPSDKEKYIPEIRRVDRIHRTAISFVTENEKQILREVQDYYKIKIKELFMFDTDLCNVLGPQTEQDHENQRRNKKYSLHSYDDYVVDSFKHMKLRKELLLGIHSNGFTKPKPLQQKAIIPCVNGYDVLICANRRAGKTTTLAIATLQNIDTNLQHCQALVLSYTRHEASHMLEVLDDLGNHMNCQCRVFIGGTHVREDIPKLEKCIHVVVGTAGRVYDLICRKCLRTDHIKMLVLDETSVLFDKQQRDQTRNIFQALNSDIQIILSSTSASEDSMKHFKKFLKEPICIVTPKWQMDLTVVKQFYLPFIKQNLIFDTINNFYIKLTIPQSVIFCNRKHKSDFQKDDMYIEDLTVSTLFRDLDTRGKDVIMKEFCSVCDHVLISTGFLKDEYEPPLSVIINYDFLTKRDSGITRDDSYFHEEIIVDISESGKLIVEKLKDFLF